MMSYEELDRRLADSREEIAGLIAEQIALEKSGASRGEVLAIDLRLSELIRRIESDTLWSYKPEK